MREDLAAFLQGAASRQIKLGEFDCGLWLADWIVVATGRPDPAAHLRGLGRSDIAHQMRSVMKSLGYTRVISPIEGDVGLVSLARGHCVGAIFGRCWVVLSETGGLSTVISDRVHRSIAWRVV